MYGSFNCPYTFLASLRAERLQVAGGARFEWRAVVHDPDVHPAGVPVEGELAEKLGREIQEIRGVLAPGEPYPAQLPPVEPNTTAAVAGYSSALFGSQADALRMELFDAYWIRGADIGNPAVLYELGCPAAAPGDRMREWQSQWEGTDRPTVPMMVLPDGRISRGLGALARLADMEREMCA
jgi:predicted DsbA family dithiol-disulfide isomerase